jgi:hypothetical protein
MKSLVAIHLEFSDGSFKETKYGDANSEFVELKAEEPRIKIRRKN